MRNFFSYLKPVLRYSSTVAALSDSGVFFRFHINSWGLLSFTYIFFG